MIIWSGKLHFNFSLLLWVMFVGLSNVWVNPIPFLIGSVFPDCDHKKAPMGKLFPLWLVFNHRGFTHTLLALVAFSSLVCIYDFKWGISFGVGYLLHLLEDDSTPMRIKWISGHKRRAYR